MPKVVLIAVALLLGIVVAGLPSYARAAARIPAIENFIVDETTDIASCGSFDIIRHVTALWIVLTSFDSNGNPTQLRIHITENNTASNSVTGKFFSYPGVLNLVIDLTDGSFTVSGAPIVVTLRYDGVVIQDTGRLVLDADGNFVFEAGFHDFGPNGDATLFCPLLE